MISVQNFHKSYGGSPAVQGISFQVEPGQVMGLIGPNGAGKTTILKCLVGMIPPTSGSLSVGGYDLTRDSVEVKKRLAYIPDDPNLFPDMTVEEHLTFIASAYAVSNADEKSRQLLDQFGLTAKRFGRAADLSLGMRQKLSICCAYLRDPSALLFDEPLTGLDPHGIRLLKQTVRERCNNGAAVMISSHLLAMVEDICTHVMILASGQLKFCGSLQDLKRKHAGTTEVALEKIFFETIAGSNTSPREEELQAV